MTIHRPLAVIIMAAGQGKRMQDPSIPKVLYPLAGEPMVGHVLALCNKLHSEKTVVIVGYGRERVIKYLRESFPFCQTVVQEDQLGTGHAVQQAERCLMDFNGDVLVLSGDVPLLSESTVRKLLEVHREQSVFATVLSVMMDDPTGYGRIVRTETGTLSQIVEEKDASAEIKAIREINSGIYLFDSKVLFSVLKLVDRKNAQGEYYLTDTFKLIIEQFGRGSVGVMATEDPIEVTGVNTKDQLLALESAHKERLRATNPQLDTEATELSKT